ncbi:MAG: 3-isopropylmalate dehydratase small subunit [Xanthomonadales bacterium]|jgi:3-isopropylmalate/(R)-2-methylmalate dehydratase small subunit|nr:3-isopropylmalate dehydratase small subunit [Xanthomonadales bacterium]
MDAFKTLTGPMLVLPQENIDTDQIIPGRFLTATSFDGMGDHAFADWRYDSDGNPLEDCVLNEPRAAASPILVAGRNFGCGSSREHAPRALLGFGFRVVISSEIADIFRSNSQNVGLLPVVLDEAVHRQLLAMDGESLTVDLEACEVTAPDGARHGFDIDGFARYCLLNGMDRLDYLLAQDNNITRYEESHER